MLGLFLYVAVAVALGVLGRLLLTSAHGDEYDAQAREEQADGTVGTPGCVDGYLDCRQDCTCRYAESCAEWVEARARRLRRAATGEG